jgi:hypothetical protein
MKPEFLIAIATGDIRWAGACINYFLPNLQVPIKAITIDKFNVLARCTGIDGAFARGAMQRVLDYRVQA